MTIHDVVVEKSKALESAVHAALDAADDYLETMRRLIAEQQASDEPNNKLVGRFGQFVSHGEHIVTVLEDEVLTDLNFMLDRLFAVDLAEKGEFI